MNILSAPRDIIKLAAFDRLIIVEGGESEEGGFFMPSGIYPRKSHSIRFWEKVNKHGVGGCWVWTAGLSHDGYGNFQYPHEGTMRIYAHRYSYICLVGTIPDGKELDHLCRVRNCVNPEHLEPVSHSVNILRGDGPRLAKARGVAKTKCAKGHPFAVDNTGISNSSNGTQRWCRICKRAQYRAWSAERKERPA